MRTLVVIALFVLIAVIVGFVVFDAVGSSDDDSPTDSAEAVSESEDSASESEDPVPETEDTLSGPEVPAQGVLSGRLVFTTREGCQPQVLDLENLELGDPGPETGCHLWVSDDGSSAVTAVTGDPSDSEGALALLRIENEPQLGAELGAGKYEVDWSPSGDSVAWCTEDGTVVYSLADESSQTVPGCDPRFAPDGSLLTLPDRFTPQSVLRDGEPYLTEEDLERGLPEGISSVTSVIGYDQSESGRLALLVVGAGAEDAVQHFEFWRDGELEESLELYRTPAFDLRETGGDFGLRGRLVRVSPDGNEVAITTGFPGTAPTLLDLSFGRRLTLPKQRSFSWSPDGAWLAVSTGEEIHVYGAERSDPAYTLPIAAETIAWR